MNWTELHFIIKLIIVCSVFIGFIGVLGMYLVLDMEVSHKIRKMKNNRKNNTQ